MAKTRKHNNGGGFRICGIVDAYTLVPELARKRGSRPLLGHELTQALKEGSAFQVMNHHNLVVDQGMQAITCLLGNNQGAPTVGGNTFSALGDITVATMELGNAPSPAAPAASDTVGVGSLIYQPPVTVSYSYSPTFKIIFSGVLPIGEANGDTITEEALKLSNGLLFAKATFSRPKTNAYALQFNHSIFFTRV